MSSEEQESEVSARVGKGIAAETGIACLRFEPPGDPGVLGLARREHLAPVFAVSVGFIASDAARHLGPNRDRSPLSVLQNRIESL